MKPTYQITRRDRRAESLRPAGHQITSLVTDWSFQASAPALRGPSFRASDGSQSKLPSFLLLSQGVFGAESRRESRLEGAVFGVIVARATWPIVLAVQAAATLLQ